MKPTTLILVLGVCLAGPAARADFQDGDYQYIVEANGEATLTKYTQPVYSGPLVIPSTLGGYAVTAIGPLAFETPYGGPSSVVIPDGVTLIDIGAFQNLINITTVTIPDSVTAIKSGAFQGCSNLRTLRIPSGVTSIEPTSFSDLSGLTNLVLHPGITSINASAFYYCISLTSLTIPASVATIGAYALGDSRSLERVYFLGSPPLLGSEVFYNANSNLVLYYLPGQTGWEPSFGDQPTALWDPVFAALSIVEGGSATGAVAGTVIGSEGTPIALQVSAGLGGAAWTTFGEMARLDASGAYSFTNHVPAEANSRFYRIIGP